jgi:hypothetical protein
MRDYRDPESGRVYPEIWAIAGIVVLAFSLGLSQLLSG